MIWIIYGVIPVLVIVLINFITHIYKPKFTYVWSILPLFVAFYFIFQTRDSPHSLEGVYEGIQDGLAVGVAVVSLILTNVIVTIRKVRQENS
ncbi:hypothetical protein E3U55_06365 [Filobacillus milosensis]|uniref:Uncharacterized protein n=1 Tax=Filobacillus milosensis TaxID=94137 RepID=A0A4Y8IUT3_9BACI|nr:hypothetical protein [Filobacillus milosensis]TFB22858.1 hypothetical protein E3U55_06365 [Filobacillus milosensis]